jgi:hypothetical protein
LLSLLKQQQPHQSPGAGANVLAWPVAPSVPRAEMTLLPPVMQQRWALLLLQGWCVACSMRLLGGCWCCCRSCSILYSMRLSSQQL